ncbi:MAG TPA: alpha-amylase family glycosyl hydrolase [Ktedonobacteraceae bacterium]
MKAEWPARPIIYEINTWVWLNDLSKQYKRTITLGTVPSEELDAIAALGVDAVWLMGVWERSPAGIRIANENVGLQADFHHALPDYTPADNVGSAYCVHRYVVDQHLGGPEELATARQMLAQRGLRLILDFVPNHVATDHPWVLEHPEYFVQGMPDDLAQTHGEFFDAGGTVIAHGRDPYFPPWPDVAQLNSFSPSLRQAAIETLISIAEQCDGMRCDMAMLLNNSIFERTWGRRVGGPPPEEYWSEIIQSVRLEHPNMLFMAEAYWGLEWDLQQLGFDYCYDKRLYDRLEHENAESVRLHLSAGLDYQDRLVRFIENHDEPRAAATFSPEKERAAALALMTLPGAKLLYEGQLEGRKVRPPVFLVRRPIEPIDFDLQAFYLQLLAAIKNAGLREGEWQLCARAGWPDNSSYMNLVAWCWSQNESRYLVVVNLSKDQSQARIHLPWNNLAGRTWQLIDLIDGDAFQRDGDEMHLSGFYVDLPAWRFHFLVVNAPKSEQLLPKRASTCPQE